jgi:hypothetical protein
MSRKPDPVPKVTSRGKYLLKFPDEGEEGPCMARLLPRQKNFVCEFVQNGGRNASEAYRRAGYECQPLDVAKRASELLHTEKIQLAIREHTEKQIASHGPMAVGTLISVLNNPTLKPADHMKAAEMLLDRGGYHAKTERKVSVSHSIDPADLAVKLRALSERTGMPIPEHIQKMLPAPPIDTAYQEVPEEATNLEGSGLEDLF